MTLLEAIEFVLENADLQDDGPFPEGWRSNEMCEAQEVLEKWVGEQKATLNESECEAN